METEFLNYVGGEAGKAKPPTIKSSKPMQTSQYALAFEENWMKGSHPLKNGISDSNPLEDVLNVLLVEDRPDHQRLLARKIREVGAEVTLEPNGLAACERMRAATADDQSFDLIVTDLRMPQLDGIEMIRRLREEGFTLPIIMCTSETDPAEKRRAIAAGCTHFLNKSDAQDALSRLIRRVPSDETCAD